MSVRKICDKEFSKSSTSLELIRNLISDEKQKVIQFEILKILKCLIDNYIPHIPEQF
jgi:hypothetical protein